MADVPKRPGEPYADSGRSGPPINKAEVVGVERMITSHEGIITNDEALVLDKLPGSPSFPSNGRRLCISHGLPDWNSQFGTKARSAHRTLIVHTKDSSSSEDRK